MPGLGESYWIKYQRTHDRAWVDQALGACQSADGYGHSCLGTVYNGTGKYEEAADEFQRALRADATDDNAYRGLAFAYEHMGEVAAAEQTYRSAIRTRPEYWAGYNWLGGFLYRQARYEEAAKEFAQVTELAPDNPRGYSNLCGTYIMAGGYADAVPVREKSTRVTPTHDAYSIWDCVLLPETIYRRCACRRTGAEARRSSAIFVGESGHAYYWDGQHRQESLAAYRRAIALGEEELRVNPRDAQLLSYLGVYHAMLKEKQAAAASLNKALALAPTSAEVHLNAALVASQLDDESAAIRSLRRGFALGLSPTLVASAIGFDNLHTNKQFQQLLQEKSPADSANGPVRTQVQNFQEK